MLVPFIPQMFCPLLDTTFCAMSGALHPLVMVPAMFGTFVVPLMRETLGAFPLVVRIVQVVIGVRVLPPCKPRCRIDEIPVLRHDTHCWMEWPAGREISRGNQSQGWKRQSPYDQACDRQYYRRFSCRLQNVDLPAILHFEPP